MGWDWNLISQIASVVGVAGGLISVSFLVLGVRRNARAIEGATVQSLMNFEKDVFAMIAADAPLFLKGCETPEKLSPADSPQVRSDRLDPDVAVLQRLRAA